MALSSMNGDAIPVVMRSRNDMPLIEDTLNMLDKQTVPLALIAFDNDSQDGTRELLEKHAHQVHRVAAGTYVPGQVLNRGMEASGESRWVVFLNSDCTPADPFWLEELAKEFDDQNTAALFGRQMPREDCAALFAKDTEYTFGDGSRQKYWKHCFSMASSAVRRSCWEQMPFSTELQYSEDIDWTWRAVQRGWDVRYAAESRVYHSHNYTLSQFARRHRGEGKAEAVIFPWSPWERSFLRYSLLPYVRQVLSDERYCLKQGDILQACYAPVLRFAQLAGRRRGFNEGMRMKEHRP